MRSTRIVPTLAAGALLLAACGNGSAGDTSASSAPTEATAPVQATEAGAAPDTESTDAPATATDDAPTPDTAATEPAPDAPANGDDAPAAPVPAALQFSAPLVGGGELDATALAGKPTVFWFWAPT